MDKKQRGLGARLATEWTGQLERQVGGDVPVTLGLRPLELNLDGRRRVARNRVSRPSQGFTQSFRADAQESFPLGLESGALLSAFFDVASGFSCAFAGLASPSGPLPPFL